MLLSYRTELQHTCYKHVTKPMEFYCKFEEQLICGECAENCKAQEHTFITITENNALCMVDLRKALNRAKESYSKLKESEVEIEEAIPKEKYDTSNLEIEVREYFHKLHSTLLIRENDLIQEVRNAGNVPSEELKVICADINGKLLKLTCLMNDAKNLLKNRFHTINGLGLLSELNSAVADKNVLVSEDSGNNEIQVLELDNSVANVLSKIGKVHTRIIPKYQLVEEQNLPEELRNGDSPQILPKNKSSIVAKRSHPIFNSVNDGKIKESDQVEVTHIHNPHHFYVQRISSKKTFKKLNKAIQEWCLTPESSKTIPISLYSGDLCLAKYNVDGKFYRATVEHVIIEQHHPSAKLNLKNQGTSLCSSESACNDNIVAKTGNDENRTEHSDDVKTQNVDNYPRNDLKSKYGNEEKSEQGVVDDLKSEQGVVDDLKSEQGVVDDLKSEQGIDDLKSEQGIDDLKSEQCIDDLKSEHGDDLKSECDIQIKDCDMQAECDNIRVKESDGQTIGIEHLQTDRNDDAQNKDGNGVRTNSIKCVKTLNKKSDLSVWAQIRHNANAQISQNLKKIIQNVDKKPNENIVVETNLVSEEKGEENDEKVIVPHDLVVSTTKSKVSPETETKFKVSFYDFGNSDIVPISSLRTMPKAFSSMPPIAIKCSLWEIVPQNNADWPYEASLQFRKYIDRKIVTMRVMDKRAGFLEVDLIHAVSEELEYDCPVSLREALIFSEVAYFPQTQPAATLEVLKQSRPKHLQYYEPEPLSLKATLTVNVTAIDSPNCFFVQLSTSHLQLKKLQAELEAFYNKENCEIDLRVFAPLLDHPYVALLDDNKYHRLVVKELPGKALVIAKDVDYGTELKLHCGKLRKITDSFITLPSQAYCCCLAGLKPSNNESWTKEAVEFFKTYVKSANLRMVIHRMVAMTGYVVSLYLDDSNRPEIYENLNGLLVQKGFALSIGLKNEDVEVPRHKIIDVSGAVIVKPKKKKKSERKLKEHAASIESASVSPAYTLVKIVCYQDAGCFYVHLLEHLESLHRFMDDLRHVYEDSKAIPNVTYEVDEQCAVYNERLDKWYRGTVQSKDDEEYLIHCLDFGFCLLERDTSMRVLLNRFKGIENYAVRCHLYGIKPAGDSKNWSGVSMQIFTEKVQENKLMHIERKPKQEGVDSLPVIMYDQVTIIGGALEPDREEMVNVNQYLLECGVAIPTRNLDEEFVSKNDNVKVVPILVHMEPKVPTVKLVRPRSGTTWLPAPIPTWKNHQVYPTYVGYDGFIYLQTKNGMMEKAIEMSASLERAYEESLFTPSMLLEEGQICVARFSLDQKWYRSRVTKIRPEEAEVVFVDFGNGELIKLDEIRVQVAFLDVPIQNLKCELYNVKPISGNGQWPIEALNFMHSAIVEKNCVACIKEPVVEGGKAKISLTLPGGMSLADYMVKNKYAEKLETSDDDFLLFKPNNFNDPFPDITIPEIGSKIPVTVSYILQYNLICVQKIKTENPKTYDEMKANREFDNFVTMFNKLQIQAPNSPIVEDPQKDEIYCAEYDQDGFWYRVLVSDIKDGQAVVFYLDYGNTEEIPLIDKRIRKLSEEFYNYPKHGMICKLHGVSISDPAWNKQITSFMSSLLVYGLEEGSKYLFEIKVKSSPYMEVELYILQNDCLSIAYQKYIDNNTLIKAVI